MQELRSQSQQNFIYSLTFQLLRLFMGERKIRAISRNLQTLSISFNCTNLSFMLWFYFFSFVYCLDGSILEMIHSLHRQNSSLGFHLSNSSHLFLLGFQKLKFLSSMGFKASPLSDFCGSGIAQISHHFQRWAFHPCFLELQIGKCYFPRVKSQVKPRIKPKRHRFGFFFLSFLLP